jgi:hypothetical protein
MTIKTLSILEVVLSGYIRNNKKKNNLNNNHKSLLLKENLQVILLKKLLLLRKRNLLKNNNKANTKLLFMAYLSMLLMAILEIYSAHVEILPMLK